MTGSTASGGRAAWLGSIVAAAAAVLFVSMAIGPTAGQETPGDKRSAMLRDADHYSLRRAEVRTLGEWKARQEEIKQILLIRTGLWPEPEKTPLNAKVFDEQKSDGFTVSKVYYQSLPGYFATGNLYRPTRGTAPYPAVITAHGHWRYGRLTNGQDGSIPGRCIDFARMGFVVFAIDMVGYNDSFQLPHDDGKSRAQLVADEPLPYEPRMYRGDFLFPEAELYGMNLAAAQLIDAVRGVDFLSSLPEVDKDRIGATGASGGASQTLMLMTADDRIKVAAPVNIIGAEKHPGCLCENPPGLWITTSTVEMAAAFSPRPLLLVSASEDPWTNSTPTREYPMIKAYYDLYNAGDMVKNVHINAGHNYNAQTRAAVYEWFCKHLRSEFPPIADPPPVAPEMKSLGDLRVFPDMMLPEEAISGKRVIGAWKTASEKALTERFPSSREDLTRFAADFRDPLRRALAIDPAIGDEIVSEVKSTQTSGNLTRRTTNIGRKGQGDWIELESIGPAKPTGALLLTYPEEWGGLVLPGQSQPQAWIKPMVDKGYRVYRVAGYASGKLAVPASVYDSFGWSSTYNRSNQLNAVQDVLTALRHIKKQDAGLPITVVGLGRCGLPAAFAAALFGEAGKVLADLNRSNPGYDGDLVKLMPAGGIKRVGDFRTAMLLLVNRPLTILNPGSDFDGKWFMDRAGAVGFAGNLTIVDGATMHDIAGRL